MRMLSECCYGSYSLVWLNGTNAGGHSYICQYTIGGPRPLSNDASTDVHGIHTHFKPCCYSHFPLATCTSKSLCLNRNAIFKWSNRYIEKSPFYCMLAVVSMAAAASSSECGMYDRLFGCFACTRGIN